MSSQKRAAADGENREESLLQETASKEAAMSTRMEELQAELRQARITLANALAESERLGGLSAQLKKVTANQHDLSPPHIQSIVAICFHELFYYLNGDFSQAS